MVYKTIIGNQTKVVSKDTKQKPDWKEIQTCARVQPAGLSVSRTIGDFGVKFLTPGAIIPTPEIISYRLQGGESYVLICCDGITDVLSNDQIHECLTNWRFLTINLRAEKLIDLALTKGSTDNCTVILIEFEPQL